MRVATQNKKLGLVCLWIHLKQKHNYTRTIQGLYKLLIREGIITVSKKRKRYKSKPYEPILFPGERFQVDVKYVPKECLTMLLFWFITGVPLPNIPILLLTYCNFCLFNVQLKLTRYSGYTFWH